MTYTLETAKDWLKYFYEEFDRNISREHNELKKGVRELLAYLPDSEEEPANENNVHYELYKKYFVFYGAIINLYLEALEESCPDDESKRAYIELKELKEIYDSKAVRDRIGELPEITNELTELLDWPSLHTEFEKPDENVIESLPEYLILDKYTKEKRRALKGDLYDCVIFYPKTRDVFFGNPDTEYDVLLGNPDYLFEDKFHIVELSKKPEYHSILRREILDKALLIDFERVTETDIKNYVWDYEYKSYVHELVRTALPILENESCETICEKERTELREYLQIISKVSDYNYYSGLLLLSSYGADINIATISEDIAKAYADEDLENKEFWDNAVIVARLRQEITDEFLSRGKRLSTELRKRRVLCALLGRENLTDSEINFIKIGIQNIENKEVIGSYIDYVANEIIRLNDIVHEGEGGSQLPYAKAISTVGQIGYQIIQKNYIDVDTFVVGALLQYSRELGRLDCDFSSVLKDGLEKLETKEATNPTNVEEINWNEYMNLFTGIAKRIVNIGYDFGDSMEYGRLRLTLINTLTGLRRALPSEFRDAFIEGMDEIESEFDNFKDGLDPKESLSEKNIKSIRLFNQLMYVKYSMEDGLAKPMNSSEGLNNILMEKLIQTILIRGISGPKGNLYRDEFLKHDKTYRAANDIKKVPYVVQKFGNGISIKERVVLIKMDDDNAVDTVCRTLGISPEEFLAYSSEYDAITNSGY